MSQAPEITIDLLLVDARLADGSTADVALVGDRIATVGSSLDRTTAAEVVEITNRLLLPAPAEPHTHLDKAFTVDQVPNPAGDLAGAIDAWVRHRSTITHADFVERATAAAQRFLANGCTAVRTHVDLGSNIGTTGLEALLEVKAALARRVDLQLVGLLNGLTGPQASAQRANLTEAVELGLDVIGGVPHLEDDPAEAIDVVLDVAGQAGLPVDLHADENLDPTSQDLAVLAERVLATGFEPPVTASHCVALGMNEPSHQRQVAEQVAEAGIAVVALPQTNLYLQGRDHPTATPRGLTAVAALQGAGVTVAAGADNVRDPFNPVGRADPLETASLVVAAAHRQPVEAYEMVSSQARLAMGLAPVAIKADAPAELLAIDAASPTEAVAVAPAQRLVIHRGRVVSGAETPIRSG